MIIDFILFLLLGGLPYYIYFEKTKLLPPEKIFLLSAFLVSCGLIISIFYAQKIMIFFTIITSLASLYSLYRAYKTNNLYKLITYILFFNAPILMLFEGSTGILYGIALLLTLLGLYLMGSYYERNYGSANYQSITGIILVTPYAGLFLTIYLTSLALYPPFPNSLLFFNAILSSESSFLWYIVVAVIFFGNFLIGARMMAKTVFGKPNQHVHYIDLTSKERWIHFSIFALLLLLSIVGLKELLS
jgi:hypothetical protein